MAKYTIRVKEICENEYYIDKKATKEELENFDFSEGEWHNTFDTKYKSPFDKERQDPEVDTILEDVYSKIFDFDFMCFNEDTEQDTLDRDNPTRKRLCIKILKYYYMHEIGFETIGLWKLKLNEKLNRIMPYYNQMYASVLLNKENPLVNHDLTDSSTRNTTTENTNKLQANETSNNTNKRIVEDTPTTRLGDEGYASGITTDNYNGTNNTDTSREGNGTTNDIYNRKVTGLSNYSKQLMLRDYRNNIINIDESIIMELFDLFMLIY